MGFNNNEWKCNTLNCKCKSCKKLGHKLKQNFLSHSLDFKKLKVVEISGCNLQSLPSGFKLLINLKYLNLSNNKFSELPLCLFNLEKLEYLDVGRNSIKHFPNCDLVRKLKNLKLNDNSFEGIPHWFLTFACHNLEEFDYSHNRATHYEFWKYSYLDKVKIKKLVLRNSCLIGNDLLMIKRFKNLEYLDLSNEVTHEPRVLRNINKFKDIDTALFVKPSWKYLSVLKLMNLNLTMFPQGIMWLEYLQELNISHNYISWIGEGMEYLVNLEILDISSNNLYALPKNIELLEYLHTLKASYNRIESVSNLPKSIKFLDLYENFIDLIPNCDMNFSQLSCDLECNFIAMNNVEGYAKGRDNFREIFGKQHRSNIVKVLTVPEENDDSSSCSSNDFSDIDIPESEEFSFVVNNNIQNTENNSFSNSKMPEDNLKELLDIFEQKIYVADEDWMFVDVECN